MHDSALARDGTFAARPYPTPRSTRSGAQETERPPAGSESRAKPEIEVPLGRLRPVRPTDVEALTWLLNEPSIRRYLSAGRIVSRTDVAAMCARSACLDEVGLGLWTVETTRATLAGLAGLAPTPPQSGAPPVSAPRIAPTIALDPEFRGRGVARRALRALADYAGGALRLSGLDATVDHPNHPAHRLMRSCGFAEVARRPGPLYEVSLYHLTLGDVPPVRSSVEIALRDTTRASRRV